MSLTDTFLKKGKVTSLRKSDGNGLYIQANAAKTKYRLWRFKYKRPFDKKEDMLSLGKYPEVSLAEAREKAREAQKVLAQGLDPKQEIKAARINSQLRAQMIFERVAAERLESQTLKDSTRAKKKSRLVNYVYPVIGKMPIDTITTIQLSNLIKKIVSDGKYETAGKVRRDLKQVFLFAIQSGYIKKENPAHYLDGLIPPHRERHRPAILDPQNFGVLLQKIDSYNANSVVGLALRLAPLVFQRPNEIVTAEWADMDFHGRMWTIPKEKMKGHITEDHKVPLSSQSLTILQELKKITGSYQYVFSNQKTKGKHISTASLVKALRSLGYNTKEQQSTHGFRSSARTMLDEQLKVPEKYIEQQLAHAVPDTLGRAYNRTSFLKERIEMMQQWADYLDELKNQ